MTLENFLVFIPLIILAFVIGLVLSKYLFKQKEDLILDNTFNEFSNLSNVTDPTTLLTLLQALQTRPR